MTPFETFNPSHEKNSNSSQEFQDGPEEVHLPEPTEPEDQTPVQKEKLSGLVSKMPVEGLFAGLEPQDQDMDIEIPAQETVSETDSEMEADINKENHML